MRDHVASYRFLRILHELCVTLRSHTHHRSGTRIGGDLVDDDDGHVELLGYYTSEVGCGRTLLQSAEVSAQLLLSLRQLATSTVVHAEERGDGVDNLLRTRPRAYEQMVRRLVLHNLRCSSRDDVHLLLVRVGASEENVIEYLLSVQPITLCDLHDALRPTTCEFSVERRQGSLGVQEDHFAVGSMPGMKDPFCIYMSVGS